MNEKNLYGAWGGLFVLCAVMGTVPPANGLVKAVMVLLSALFFVPGGILLYRGIRQKDRGAVLRIRILSALSLGLTFLLIVLNFLSVGLSTALGDLLYAILIIVSAPMVCSQFWVASLFLWACLLMTSILYAPKKS